MSVDDFRTTVIGQIVKSLIIEIEEMMARAANDNQPPDNDIDDETGLNEPDKESNETDRYILAL